jgi:hypothetical protein
MFFFFLLLFFFLFFFFFSVAASSSSAAAVDKRNEVEAVEKEKTSADYYFNSYSHFGAHLKKNDKEKKS